MNKPLTAILGIEYPVIMAPMFLVSKLSMSLAATKAGIAACIPALNFRTQSALEDALTIIQREKACIGINLIANRSNYKLADQLASCLKFKVPFIISSLGNPKPIIEACKPLGIKVFCDVSTMEYAEKTALLKPDALIAITSLAGGHLGPSPPDQFVPQLVERFPEIPIISAGGVGDNQSFRHMLGLGASGVSVGTVFIASVESPVNQEYKDACVQYSEKDIVLSYKLSGIPCTVINTPYVQASGTDPGWLQKLLLKNRALRKWLKLITYKRGMGLLQKAAFNHSYQTVWCAGSSIRFTDRILPVGQIIQKIVTPTLQQPIRPTTQF